jgi:aspartyl-tRNA synthetase
MSFRKNNSVSYLYPDEPENVAGFLKSKRILSSKLAFATVSREAGHHRDIQVIIENEWLIRVLKKTRLHSVVSISGQWRPVGQRGSRHGADDGGQGEAITKPALQETSTIEPAKQGVSVPGQPERFEKDGKEKEKEKEYLASFFKVINQAPARPLTGEDTLPPHERVLQLRFYPELGARLRFRSFLQREFIDVATRKYEYTQITTPTLFKSTPEGAREFLVPTRAKGTAYALTQSPQQYKQALMAAGIRGYIQFAPCWRDEDLRQDRQPEFLQLDMEKAFTNRDTVMAEIQSIVRHVLDRAGRNFRWQQLQTRGKSEWVPIRLSEVDRVCILFLIRNFFLLDLLIFLILTIDQTVVFIHQSPGDTRSCPDLL